MWYSLHGFIHDFKAIDDYLKSDFQSVIQEDMETYFFIRYWLGGPHVRLRFKCKQQDYLKIKGRFEASITNFITHNSVNLIDYDQFYETTMLENENITQTYWCDHGSVAEFQYEPEYDRYGGIEGMSQSEEIFYESSVMANQLNRLSFGKRVIAGLDLIYMSFLHINEDEDIYQKYADFWEVFHSDGDMLESYKPILKQRLNYIQQCNLEQHEVYKNYFQMIKASDIHKNSSTLISHVHMTNNRLGIFPSIEYSLATFIANHVRAEVR